MAVTDEQYTQLVKGLGEVQDTLDRVKGELDTLDREKIERAFDFATKGFEAHQAEFMRRVDAQADAAQFSDMPAVSAYRKALFPYLRNKTGRIPEDTILDFANAMAEHLASDATDEQKSFIVKELVTANDTQGGYWIVPDKSEVPVQHNFETSPMRSLATVITTTSGAVELLLEANGFDEPGSGFVRTETGMDETDVGKLIIPVHEQYAEPKATQKMLDDATIDVESWLVSKVEAKFTRDESFVFVNGNGINEPNGFLNLSAWAVAGNYETSKLEQIDAGATGAFTASGILALQGSLKEVYQAHASWVMKRESFFDILGLKDTAGQFLFQRDLLKEGAPLVLLGKPVVFMADMPTVANDALAAAYGDFGQGYTIVDRIGTRVLVDALTEKPYVKFYTTKRVGGDVTNFEAIKIGKTRRL